MTITRFPLIQLPRKSEVVGFPNGSPRAMRVSINSTSEEVRRLEQAIE